MGTRRVKFIGKTPYKKDNVCRTDLYWGYPGAICEAQEDIAVRLFAHPMVWVEPDEDDEGLPESEGLIESLSGNLTREERIEIAISIIIDQDCIGEINEYFGEVVINSPVVDMSLEDLDNASDEEITDLEPKGDVVDISDGLSNAAPVTTSANFSADRNEAIIQAINLLDRNNIETHFTKEGNPRVEAIEGLLDYDITAQERTAAWEEITESETGGGDE